MNNKEIKTIRLTQQNAHKYIGYEILFKTREEHIVKGILKVNKSSIKIDHHNLSNNLNINREIHVIIK